MKRKNTVITIATPIFNTTTFQMLTTIPHAIRGCASKSLARPGRKQATMTKLRIYSTHSPRSSIHFLARCFNFCKSLKKIQKVVHPTRSLQQQ